MYKCIMCGPQTVRATKGVEHSLPQMQPVFAVSREICADKQILKHTKHAKGYLLYFFQTYLRNNILPRVFKECEIFVTKS